MDPVWQRIFKPGKVARRDERRKIMLEIPVFLLTRFEICVRNVIDGKYRQVRGAAQDLADLRSMACPVVVVGHPAWDVEPLPRTDIIQQ
jgi:hypothetical protein